MSKKGPKRKYETYEDYLAMKNEKMKLYYQEHAEEIRAKARDRYHKNKNKGAEKDGKQ